MRRRSSMRAKRGGRAMVERSEFKGKPVLILKRDENDKYPFAFGLSKAKMMLENIEEIKRFVEENDKAADQ
jgi:ERCC4-related helicase